MQRIEEKYTPDPKYPKFMVKDYVHFHKCVRGHWEIWFLAGTSVFDTKVFRPWVVGEKARILAHIAWLKAQKAYLQCKQLVVSRTGSGLDGPRL